VVGVHAVDPAVADDLIERPPGEAQPLVVEPVATAIGARAPHEDDATILDRPPTQIGTLLIHAVTALAPTHMIHSLSHFRHLTRFLDVGCVAPRPTSCTPKTCTFRPLARTLNHARNRGTHSGGGRLSPLQRGHGRAPAPRGGPRPRGLARRR